MAVVVLTKVVKVLEVDGVEGGVVVGQGAVRMLAIALPPRPLRTAVARGGADIATTTITILVY